MSVTGVAASSRPQRQRRRRSAGPGGRPRRLPIRRSRRHCRRWIRQARRAGRAGHRPGSAGLRSTSTRTTMVTSIVASMERVRCAVALKLGVRHQSPSCAIPRRWNSSSSTGDAGGFTVLASRCSASTPERRRVSSAASWSAAAGVDGGTQQTAAARFDDETIAVDGRLEHTAPQERPNRTPTSPPGAEVLDAMASLGGDTAAPAPAAAGADLHGVHDDGSSTRWRADFAHLLVNCTAIARPRGRRCGDQRRWA